MSNNFNFMKQILFSLFCFPIFCLSQDLDSSGIKTPEEKAPAETLPQKIKMQSIDDVIMTGTLKPVSRSKSPVAVEIYSQKFSRKTLLPIFLKQLPW